MITHYGFDFEHQRVTRLWSHNGASKALLLAVPGLCGGVSAQGCGDARASASGAVRMIEVGDKVRTGVYLCGEWKPMWLGTVTGMSSDGTTASVDIGSMHGCAPNLRFEQISHLRREPEAA